MGRSYNCILDVQIRSQRKANDLKSSCQTHHYFYNPEQWTWPMRWSGALILLGNEPNSFALMYVKPFATRNLQTQHFGDLQKHRSENVLVKQTR